MASEPRTIKGPCFDECKDGRNPDGTRCKCEYFALTEPHEKIEPEQQNCGDCSGGYYGDKYEPCGCDCHDEPVRKPETRPNVPPCSL